MKFRIFIRQNTKTLTKLIGGKLTPSGFCVSTNAKETQPKVSEFREYNLIHMRNYTTLGHQTLLESVEIYAAEN